MVFAAGGSGDPYWVGGAILALFILRPNTSVIGCWLLTRVNQKAAAQMQADLVRHLLTLDGSFFKANSPGTLIERVQGDTASAQWAATMVIAHRLSTVMRADKTIVLDQGRLIKEGTHDASMAKAGHYGQLQQAQLRD